MATPVLAVDLGAGSARVARVDLDGLDGRPARVEVVHRYAHEPVRDGRGTLRWDWSRLVAEVERGLSEGLARGPVASIGVDTWGVDYGLLSAGGELVAPPVSYRDERTEGWRGVVERVGGDEALYRRTGIQLMPINTIFQLAAHDRTELAAARRLLMLPELVVHALTGVAAGEVTSAGTTALVDLATGTWAHELLDAIDVDPALLPPLQRAGAPVGTWRGVPVHLVGGHDTASAVAAVAPSPGRRAAFVSSGTWMLVGVERPEPSVGEAARRANLSNEPGVLGGVRLLRNVMGLWLLERCRAEWGDPPLAEVLAAAASVAGGGPQVDATDERFTHPASMEAELRSAAGLPASAGPDVLARCALDSLAAGAARVVAQLEDVTGEPVDEVHVVGGGVQVELLNRLLEEAVGRPVVRGVVEATALGNALVQGVALGRFADLAAARAALVVAA